MSRLETRLRYNSGHTEGWSTVFDFNEDGGQNSASTNVGLSWRILGTTGGGGENFCAYEAVYGNVSIQSTRNNNNSISVVVAKNIEKTNYDVSTPDQQVVGATFTGGAFNADTTYSTHTKADGEDVGSSFDVHVEAKSETVTLSANASSVSGETVFASMYESATNTKVWRDFRIVNTLPPDYRPWAVKYGNDWQSCNRNGGMMSVRKSGQWVECRTQDGGVGEGNPPSIREGGKWKNARKVGING